ncbi:MAG TPA: hypothetical protein DCE41_12005 [Cytophagales bacterium]|nr:hypothetical protein [Cytophagales bacterium]
MKNGLNRAAKKEKNSNDFESFKEVIGYLKEKMLDTAFTSAQEGFDLMEKLQENSNLTQTRRWKEAFKNTESAFGEWQFIVALGNYFHRLAGDEFKKWTKAKLEVAYVKDGKTHVKSYENK